MDQTRRAKKEKRTFSSLLIDFIIKVSSPLVVVVSAVLLVFVFLLSYYLPLNEKEALIRKTDDFCISTAMGLSSVSIQGISYNKRAIVSDYLNDVSKQKIQGLVYARVIEYQWKKEKRGKKSLTGGKIIASLKPQDNGKTVSTNELESLLKIETFNKTVLAGKNGNILEYTYPIVWKTKRKGVSENFLLGAIRLRFSEKEILQSYYSFRVFSNQVATAAAFSSVIIVYFYLVLVRLLKRKLREIEEMSVTDALTKIYNRKKFDEAVGREIQRFKRYHEPLSLIMFDIDHFKSVNDTFGHDAGDTVLVAVAEVVGKAVRNTDLFARWGGEEFMVLAPNTGGKETGDFANRIRQDIEKHEFGTVKKITCSFGVTSLTEKDTEDSFLARADAALYYSKEKGRNRVTLNLPRD